MKKIINIFAVSLIVTCNASYAGSSNWVNDGLDAYNALRDADRADRAAQQEEINRHNTEIQQRNIDSQRSNFDSTSQDQIEQFCKEHPEYLFQEAKKELFKTALDLLKKPENDANSLHEILTDAHKQLLTTYWEKKKQEINFLLNSW